MDEKPISGKFLKFLIRCFLIFGARRKIRLHPAPRLVGKKLQFLLKKLDVMASERLI